MMEKQKKMNDNNFLDDPFSNLAVFEFGAADDTSYGPSAFSNGEVTGLGLPTSSTSEQNVMGELYTSLQQPVMAPHVPVGSPIYPPQQQQPQPHQQGMGQMFQQAQQQGHNKTGKEQNSEWAKRRREQVAKASRAAREKRKREVQGLRMENERLRTERDQFLEKIQQLQLKVEALREEGSIDLQLENELLKVQLEEHKKFVGGFMKLASGMPSSQIARKTLYKQGADYAVTHALSLVSQSLKEGWVDAPLPPSLLTACQSIENGKPIISVCYMFVDDFGKVKVPNQEKCRQRLNIRIDIALPDIDVETVASLYWGVWTDEREQATVYGLQKDPEKYEFKQLFLEDLESDNENSGNPQNDDGGNESDDDNSSSNKGKKETKTTTRRKKNNDTDNKKKNTANEKQVKKENSNMEAATATTKTTTTNKRRRKRSAASEKESNDVGDSKGDDDENVEDASLVNTSIDLPGALISAAYFRERYPPPQKDKDWVFVSTKRTRYMARSTIVRPENGTQTSSSSSSSLSTDETAAKSKNVGTVKCQLLARSTTQHLKAPNHENTQRITSLLIEGCLLWSDTDVKTQKPFTRLVTVLSLPDDIRLRTLDGFASILNEDGSVATRFGDYFMAFIQRVLSHHHHHQ